MRQRSISQTGTPKKTVATEKVFALLVTIFIVVAYFRHEITAVDAIGWLVPLAGLYGIARGVRKIGR